VKKKGVAAASVHLLAHLPHLARQMKSPLPVQETQGRFKKRNLANGYTHEFLWKSPTTVGLFQIDVKALRELGCLLERIDDGEDARVLFRQTGKKKPKRTAEHQTTAMAYWSVRALNPCALRKARSIYPQLNLSDATIRKLAQTYREMSLNVLRMGAKFGPLKFKESRTYINLRSEAQIDALREHLRKKSARPDV
jgi:hypothetical protein